MDKELLNVGKNSSQKQHSSLQPDKILDSILLLNFSEDALQELHEHLC